MAVVESFTINYKDTHRLHQKSLQQKMDNIRGYNKSYHWKPMWLDNNLRTNFILPSH